MYGYGYTGRVWKQLGVRNTYCKVGNIPNNIFQKIANLNGSYGGLSVLAIDGELCLWNKGEPKEMSPEAKEVMEKLRELLGTYPIH